MNKKIIPFLIVSSALLAACNPEAATTASAPTTSEPTPVTETTPAVAKEDAVAMVNGVAITKATFKTLEDEITQRSQGQKFPKKQLLEELIQRELLVQDAHKKHLDESAEVKERIKMAQNSLLTQAAVQDYLKASPITDADLKTVYDKEVAAKMSGIEYKARHILVKKEEDAKKIIAKLNKGEKFETLAKANSIDPSKDQGGDLGWFTAGQMVEPFSKAVAALEKGKYTTAPVQTQFGWHVILREDSRSQTPPPFDSVKEQLRPAVQQQKIQAMLEKLRKEAKVEVLMSTDEPKPETAATPATAPDAQKTAPATDAKAQPTGEPAKSETVSPASEPAKTDAGSKSDAATSSEPAKTDAPVTTEVQPTTDATKPTEEKIEATTTTEQAVPASK